MMFLILIDFRDFSAFMNPSLGCTIVYLVEGTSLFRFLSSVECNDQASVQGMTEASQKIIVMGQKC
jgi:hypothetical protein